MYKENGDESKEFLYKLEETPMSSQNQKITSNYVMYFVNEYDIRKGKLCKYILFFEMITLKILFFEFSSNIYCKYR